jgi:hypothetical protein
LQFNNWSFELANNPQIVGGKQLKRFQPSFEDLSEVLRKFSANEKYFNLKKFRL